MKCAGCGGKILEYPRQVTPLCVIHDNDKCYNMMIDKHVAKVEKKKKAEKAKKKKKLPSWYRKKAIERAKTIAKERDGYVCQHCGKTRTQSQIQASHDISIGQCVWLAADPMNITALCAYCHLRWWHSNPIESAEWHKEKFPERNAYLQEKKKHQVKVNWEEVYNNLMNQ